MKSFRNCYIESEADFVAVSLSSMKQLAIKVESNYSNKAYFQTENKQKIHVQFNPEQFRISKSVQYSSSHQKEQPYIEFSGIVLPQLDISFFLDTSGILEISGVMSKNESDVTVLTRKFEKMMEVSPNLHRPPIVKFIWGSVCFSGFIKHVNVTYTMFNKNGMPIRAKVDTQLMGIPEESSTKIPLESPDRTKSRVVSEETSIWSLAGQEYGDISKWRVIAKANGIMDPFHIPAGMVLKVPALE